MGTFTKGSILTASNMAKANAQKEAHISCSHQKDGSHQYQEPKLCLDYI